MVKRNKTYPILFLLLMVFIQISCEKTDESGFLDNPYHHVADVKEYCNGACETLYDWENADIGIKGHIRGINNTETMNQYRTSAHFFLEDVRNGMFAEIKVKDNIDIIFDTLMVLQKNDQLFIKGIARSILATDGTKCKKGVFIDLCELENIKLNIK